MRICKVWDDEYPWDVRVEKICRSLVSAGHQVHLVCRNRRREAIHEIRDGISIHRLRPLCRPLDAPLTFPAFFNPVWLSAIARVVRQQDCNLILVRDLPLALAGILVGRVTGRPVALDFAENYPAMLQDFWPRNRRQPFNWFARNPWLAGWVERIATRLADHILVVVQESFDRLRQLGVEPGRLSIVMNTPLPERFSGREPVALAAEASNPHFDIVYLGLLDPARGLETAIRAMPAITAKISNARLVIIGDGNHKNHLQDLALRTGNADRIHFKGWIPYDRAHEWIAAAHIGIVPHVTTVSWMTTIPNKLFDYMALGKPVVVSEAQPVRRIVENEQCGLVFRHGDARDFAAQILRLAEPGLRRFFGANGRRAVLERYNWLVDERALLESIEEARMRTEGVGHGTIARPTAR